MWSVERIAVSQTGGKKGITGTMGRGPLQVPYGVGKISGTAQWERAQKSAREYLAPGGGGETIWCAGGSSRWFKRREGEKKRSFLGGKKKRGKHTLTRKRGSTELGWGQNKILAGGGVEKLL